MSVFTMVSKQKKKLLKRKKGSLSTAFSVPKVKKTKLV